MSALTINVRLRRSDNFELRLSCAIADHATTAIYGPSGCGKTSLLYCLAGLLPGDESTRIQFRDTPWQENGTCVPTHLRGIGMVFQDGRLFPHLSALGNLRYAQERQHRPGGPALEQVCDWLQLGPLLDRYPQQLSAGQQQRVAIGRALINNPAILFMDEPLANLDRSSRRDIMRHLQTLQAETNIPMIYVSHDMEEVARLSDRLIVLDHGSIVADGATLELSSHLELAIAHEEQAAAIISAAVSAAEPEFGLTRLSLGQHNLYVASTELKPDALLRLRIPARDVSLCLTPPSGTSILNILPATIVEIEGGDSNRLLVKLQVDDQFLLARITRKSIVALGLEVGTQLFAQIKTVALLHD